MRVITIPARQGHSVPARPYRAGGPFPPEVTAKPVVHHDDAFEELPAGATAQNNYRGLPFYECSICAAVVREDEIPFHVCPEDDDDER